MRFEMTEQIERHLSNDAVAWLTTVSAAGVPSSRPIWFVWDGSAIAIYSLNTAARLKNIRANDQVSVHFNTTPDGGDVVTLTGPAEIDEAATAPSQNDRYMSKYGRRMEESGLDLAMVDRDYGVMIRVVPDSQWTA